MHANVRVADVALRRAKVATSKLAAMCTHRFNEFYARGCKTGCGGFDRDTHTAGTVILIGAGASV